MSLNSTESQDGGVEVSVREITHIEEQFLTIIDESKQECETQNCNLHIWKLESPSPNTCDLFKDLNVIAVALGGEHCLVLTEDRKVYSQGSNYYGQLGLGDTDSRDGINLIIQLNDLNVKQIACGARHNCAVCEDGSMYCWGDSRKGQCGLSAKGIFTTPTRVNFAQTRKITDHKLSDNYNTGIKEVSCGELFSAAIDFKGMVWTWGTGFGLGHGEKYEECTSPKLVQLISHRKAIQLVCGSFHCLVLTQDEYKDSQLTFSSHDLRTCSVSSAYYSELKLQSDASASKIPFLQSSFYTSGNEEEDTDDHLVRKSFSETDVSSHDNALEKLDHAGVSVSEIDLRDKETNSSDNNLHLHGLNMYRKQTRKLLNGTSDESVFSVTPDSVTPDYTSTSSVSQYYSAVDITSSSNKNTLKETNQDDKNITSQADENIEDNNSLENENLTSSSEANTEEPKALSKKKMKDVKFEEIVNSPFQEIEVVFQGKKPLFESASIDDLRSSGLPTNAFAEPEVKLTQSNLFQFYNNTKNNEESSFFENPMATEVWCWGNGSHGQLGNGDSKDRWEPCLIDKLTNKSIIKLAAGAYHSIANTVQGQIYNWGDNTFGQLALSLNVVFYPRKVKVLTGTRIWDIACGRNFSLFLGDSERNKTDVYFCGEVHSPKCTRSISNPIIDVASSTNKKSKKTESRWRLSRRSKRTSEGYVSPTYVDIQIRKLVHFSEDELVRCVYANDYTFACVTQKDCKGSEFEAIYKFTRTERLFYQQLKIIQKALIEPLIKTEAWTNISKTIGGECLIPLIDAFVELLNGIAVEIKHLSNVIHDSQPNNELFAHLFSDSCRALYDRYSKCYADALSVGAIHACNKPLSQIISKIKDIIKDLEEHLSLSQASFESLLKVPMMRTHVYCDIAKRLTPHFKNKDEADQLKEVISRWLEFNDLSTVRLISAGVTNKYWNECHTKLIEALKDPLRRVLKSSKIDPLTMSRGARFMSSHSYILFNDVFVHVQFNRNFQVFPLITLWVDNADESEHGLYSIRIASPEEIFILTANNAQGKIGWLTELNLAIASCLSACSSHSLDVGSVNLSTGLLKAAVAREAEYQFVTNPKYKTATYKGMWLNALPHGRGRMIWPDKCCYEGEFVDGYFHGYGQMVWPFNEGNDKIYDGEWVNGDMNGYGRMRYPNGEEYLGIFKDNMRHGHGTLKSSQNKNTLDTIYVGNWVNDVRSGYGVLDYIIRGEKYMGMWVNDQRHGQGVVVTVDGVYYEGNFFQNRLAGKGILLSDDDTSYEGEFTADMLLSGKGVLTLPNGDFIDGSFYGNWGESIKVNGVFSKFTNQRNASITISDRSHIVGSSGFTIDANLKWHSLFDECYRTLGCNETFECEPEEAWERAFNALVKGIGSMQTSRNPANTFDLDAIRNRNYKELMSLATNLKGLQDYLAQIFDTPGHPLNLLVEGLIEVYRATYIGVGAHRRLLQHAVAEAKSYVSRLFHILRVLFPDLHDEEFVLLSNETVDGETDTAINSMSLLHPLLLPRIYPPLFTLYALQTERTDAVYTEKLYYLNKRRDVALLSFLGVKKTFWLLPDETTDSEDNNPPPSFPATSKSSYDSAIDTLGRISTSYSPMEKIEVIRRTFAKIHEDIDEHHKGSRQVLAMDDLFPIFQYIVIRARVPHLGSEIKFIEDLVEDSVLVGEAGHMVTTLCACYYQIQNERDRD